MKKLTTLFTGDFRNIVRDPVLLLVTLLPLFIGLLVRFAMPFLRSFLLPYFDMAEHYTFIMSFMVIMAPMMYGTVVGFMLLDERDEDILTYLSVTPLTKSGYLVYRLVSPMAVSSVLFYIVLVSGGLIEIRFLELLPVALMASLEAPLLTLFLAAFASNKVEGLALSKIAGLLDMAPIAGYFIKSQWQLAAGILPPYWVSKALLAVYGQGGNSGFYILGGLLVHLAFIWLLWKVYSRRI